MASPGARKILLFATASLLAFLVLLFATAYGKKRSAELRTRDWIVQVLEQKFQSNVELADFHVRIFPRMTVSGEGLSLHYWATPDAPPLIRVETFSFELGLLGIFRAPHRIQSVRLKRMVLTIPPKVSRQPAADRPVSRSKVSAVA